MLLIGDIHICKKRQTPLLDQLREYIVQFPDEQHIVFLGDYVYHFTYERGALLALFGLFVELLQQGKEVWVLAGNHDRLQGHFVFDEARQLSLAWGTIGKHLHVITEPQLVEIEGQTIYFLPSKTFVDPVPSDSIYASLELADHPNSKQSARLNHTLKTTVDAWKTTHPQQQLFVFHHRYIVNTPFPGQYARFSYTSPGLDAGRLEETHIRLVSGHLHRAFVYKNYLCTGSIWYTSPLETNELKRVFRLSPQHTVYASPFVLNPYIHCDQAETPIDEEFLEQVRGQITQESSVLFTGGEWSVTLAGAMTPLPFANTTLTMRTPVVAYDALDTLLKPETRRLLADVKIKASLPMPSVLLEEMQDSSLQLNERIADRKVLLRRYIDAKFGERASTYRSLLEELMLV